VERVPTRLQQNRDSCWGQAEGGGEAAFAFHPQHLAEVQDQSTSFWHNVGQGRLIRGEGGARQPVVPFPRCKGGADGTNQWAGLGVFFFSSTNNQLATAPSLCREEHDDELAVALSTGRCKVPDC
jgi:hypothetical protein